jgi:enamine deaminase RidA (YjgF/YER057c/UK114 family)
MAASRNRKPAVEPLLPVELGPGKIRYAQGMRAGRWVFATGHKGTDFKGGMAPSVLRPDHPRHDKPKHKREAELIYRNLARVMRAGGTSLANLVRVDQYYTGWQAVPPYHEARAAALRGRIPPSTSNLHEKFLLAGQDIEVQAIGVIPDGDFRPRTLEIDDYTVHPTSGYSHALICGDYVFCAGMTPEALIMEEGPVDPEARVPAGHLWKGRAIKLETEFVIRRKLEPALKAAGSSLDRVVKAQVYMRDVDDFPAFNEVWSKYFPKNPPAISLIACSTPGFICPDERIEINVIALRKDGGTRKRMVRAPVAMPYAGQSVAVRAGDLLFISGLMALDGDGLIREARVDAGQPYFGSSIEAQMDYILGNAEAICRAAGTRLSNVVRIQQFHQDLAEFYPAYQVWQRHLPGHYLPFSAIELPAPPPVPGCTVLLDLWVYAP